MKKMHALGETDTHVGTIKNKLEVYRNGLFKQLRIR